jgi:hypothetical protein
MAVEDSVLKAGAIDFVAGAVGATVSVYVGQPLDTVKVVDLAIGVDGLMTVVTSGEDADVPAPLPQHGHLLPADARQGGRGARAVRRHRALPRRQHRGERHLVRRVRRLPEDGGPGYRGGQVIIMMALLKMDGASVQGSWNSLGGFTIAV